MTETKTRSEGTIVVLVALVQFVNILDFMMVMPLGPDFAAALGISPSSLGIIGGSYTAAASIAGLAGALFLDRYDRRTALAVAMLGLVAGTLAGGFANSLPALIAARVLAGLFGGPASSLALSIVADVVPTERRGRAMGTVMGAFSAASVLGVPAGLELARLGTWRTPFFAVAAFGLLVAAGAVGFMPKMRGHLDGQPGGLAKVHMRALFGRRSVLLALGLTATLMMASFALVPNISSYLQFNLGYPRAHLGRLYLVGGAVSFAIMRASGVLVDRVGAVPVMAIGSVVLAADIAAGFVVEPPLVPPMAIFVMFMAMQSFRGVAVNTLTSRVPKPAERASFQSLQSATQHLAAALGAVLSSKLLHAETGGRLRGMDRVGYFSLALIVVAPFIAAAVRPTDGAPQR